MIYKFNKFEIDTEKFELRENGITQHIGIQVFDFLHLLIKNRQRVVTREEIVNTVWNGRNVTEATISSCVKSARKLLGDDGETQKFIRTARGRGFQFVYKIDQIFDDEHDDEKNETKKPILFKNALLLFIALVSFIFLFKELLLNDQDNSVTQNGSTFNDEITDRELPPYNIAVMPFTDMSIEGNQGYFGDGIAEEILNELSNVNGLNVTSRTTSFSLRNQNLSIPEISKKLNVKYIVEGSVRNSNNRIRITAQLIDAESDTHLWSDTFDRELVDIFAIQDEISFAISKHLNGEISNSIKSRQVPTENMQAYTLYLQGHQLFMDRGTGNTLTEGEKLEQAMLVLNKAVELDPNFAAAWADLASVKIVLPTYINTKYKLENVTQDALKAANRAISRNPKLSQAWAAKGFMELSQFNFQDAELALTRAVELNPRNETAWLWLSLHYASVGFHDEAIKAVESAISLAPEIAINYGILSVIHHAKGNIDEATAILDEAINQRNYEAGRIDRVLLSIWNNNQTHAQEDIEIISSKYDEQKRDIIKNDLKLYMKAYFNSEIREEVLKQLTEDINHNSNIAFYGTYLLKDPALMIKFFNTASSNTTFNLRRIYNPLVRPIFSEKIFRDYIIQIGLFQYWQDNKFPEFCKSNGNDDFICSN